MFANEDLKISLQSKQIGKIDDIKIDRDVIKSKQSLELWYFFFHLIVSNDLDLCPFLCSINNVIISPSNFLLYVHNIAMRVSVLCNTERIENH